VQDVLHACCLRMVRPMSFRDEYNTDIVSVFIHGHRTDTCRERGLHEAAERINRTVDAGADLGLLFPRNPKDAEQAPKVCRLPLVHVMSHGNRDGRPIFTRQRRKTPVQHASRTERP
jgi:2-methylisocitrate lyase-like PEP mutase family enzyme